MILQQLHPLNNSSISDTGGPNVWLRGAPSRGDVLPWKCLKLELTLFKGRTHSVGCDPREKPLIWHFSFLLAKCKHSLNCGLKNWVETTLSETSKLMQNLLESQELSAGRFVFLPKLHMSPGQWDQGEVALRWRWPMPSSVSSLTSRYVTQQMVKHPTRWRVYINKLHVRAQLLVYSGSPCVQHRYSQLAKQRWQLELLPTFSTLCHALSRSVLHCTCDANSPTEAIAATATSLRNVMVFNAPHRGDPPPPLKLSAARNAPNSLSRHYSSRTAAPAARFVRTAPTSITK